MIRQVLFAGLLLAAHDPSCGGADPTSGGPNAPCTRDRDCNGGLSCTKGVCVDHTSGDAGADADADADADAATDGGGD